MYTTPHLRTVIVKPLHNIQVPVPSCHDHGVLCAALSEIRCQKFQEGSVPTGCRVVHRRCSASLRAVLVQELYYLDSKDIVHEPQP